MRKDEPLSPAEEEIIRDALAGFMMEVPLSQLWYLREVLVSCGERAYIATFNTFQSFRALGYMPTFWSRNGDGRMVYLMIKAEP